MKKLWDLIQKHKYAIIWTLGYAFITWAILYFLFDFSIFSRAQWHHLMRAQLRGFPGFVFGILILAALPLYIATTTLIVRTQKPLITIPIPKINIPDFLKRAPAPQPDTTPTPETENPTLGPDEIDTPIELPTDMPAELRYAFIRAHNNIGRAQTSAFNTPHPAPTTPTPQITTDSLPLPPDFDIDVPNFDDPEIDSVPTFTEINFDSPDPHTTQSDIDTEYTCDNSALINYLTENAHNFTTTDNNVVITDHLAIITHSDTDFWVPDCESWFATGRVCPSPIILVQQIAEQHNRKPAIYLASKNILDIDKHIAEWQQNGIIVITDLTEI